MEKQKITFIARYTTKQDGTPLTFTKDGKQVPYTRVQIRTDRQGDKLLSGFGNKSNENWKEGDEIEIKVTETSKDGKIYHNFETPKKDDVLLVKIETVLNDLTTVKLAVGSIMRYLENNLPKRTSDGKPMPFSNVGVEYPDDEIDPKDIPF